MNYTLGMPTSEYVSSSLVKELNPHLATLFPHPKLTSSSGFGGRRREGFMSFSTQSSSERKKLEEEEEA